MTADALRKLALALPDAREEPHMERTSFRVGKKIFATMTRDGAEAMVKIPRRDRLEALLEEQPAVFFDYGKWTWNHGCLGVRLAKVSAKLMRELVTDSWKMTAEKRPRARKKPVSRR